MASFKDANWGTLIPRFLLGVVFLFHGGQKLFGLFGGTGHEIQQLADGIQAWGWPIPGTFARAAAATEFFGGACVLIGLLTRFWAAGLFTVMLVAAWKVHAPHGFSLPNGFEYTFVLAILALSLVVQGGGAFSFDEMFFKKKAARPKSPGS